MAQKFVINDNRLILGQVDFHKELCKDNTKTVGGGYWHLDSERGILYLYGISVDYGPVTKAQLEAADKFPYGEKFTIFFTLHFTLNNAIAEFEKQHAHAIV